jgi:hypothetical protein
MVLVQLEIWRGTLSSSSGTGTDSLVRIGNHLWANDMPAKQALMPLLGGEIGPTIMCFHSFSGNILLVLRSAFCMSLTFAVSDWSEEACDKRFGVMEQLDPEIECNLRYASFWSNFEHSAD